MSDWSTNRALIVLFQSQFGCNVPSASERFKMMHILSEVKTQTVKDAVFWILGF